MDDIEKNRATYVQQLELTVQHLQGEHDKYKRLADKWEPKVTVKTDPATQKVSFGLEFGGKFTHATVTDTWLVGMDVTSAVTSITAALVDNLVEAEIRKVIQPEVERARNGAQSIQNAGKW